MRQKDIGPTTIQKTTLPSETRLPFSEEPLIREPGVMQKTPIVEEQYHKKVIEEVQPILYREVVQPVLIEQTKPIYENIQESPRYMEEEMPMRDLGTRTLDRGYVQGSYDRGYVQGSYMQQPTTGLTGLPPRVMYPQSAILSHPGELLGNIKKVEYEVKGLESSQPYVERTVYKEVPFSSLQQSGYEGGAYREPFYQSTGYGQQGGVMGQQGHCTQQGVCPKGWTGQNISGYSGAAQQAYYPQGWNQRTF